ncbi:MAG: hypothetical protein A3I83_06050 [Methylotenera sp. RIFCSPLOWO2_02_FULL_45_14]|nr:MAG: hypothetical protein A3I83_06050 [Methylotenera sp. RIFCSPLOWO2_02_FULL_45_14]
MEILGYVGFSILIFLAFTWTIGVRVQLAAGVPTIFGALFFLIAAFVLFVSGLNKLHSLWIVLTGFCLIFFINLLSIYAPFVYGIFQLIASVFADIVRVGIPEEKIRAAQDADARAAIERWREKQ